MPVLDLYEESTSPLSHPIWKLFQQDWLLLKEMDDEHCLSLFNAIFPDQRFDRLVYIPKSSGHGLGVDSWENFKEELKYENRFFPRNRPSKDYLEELFQLLCSQKNPQYLYRARSQDNATPFRLEEMGKPPNNLARNGRANPVGIAYLYTASSVQTAIAELRPHTGDHITVVKLELNSANLVDLRNPRDTISPFGIEDDLPKVLTSLEYLSRLGIDLSKPITPKGADLEYLSTQYLCALIKDLGYDGVIYKSALGEGDNYTFFEDAKLKSISCDSYAVGNIDYETTLI